MRRINYILFIFIGVIGTSLPDTFNVSLQFMTPNCTRRFDTLSDQ